MSTGYYETFLLDMYTPYKGHFTLIMPFHNICFDDHVIVIVLCYLFLKLNVFFLLIIPKI